MSDKQRTSDNATNNDAPTATKATNTENNTLQTDKPQKANKKRRRWPIFVLAFIIGSATSIFGLNYYQQTYMLKPNKPVANKLEKGTQLIQQEVSKALTSLILEHPIPTAMSSAEGKALISAINTLQESMQGLQSELENLQQQQQDAAHSQTMLEAMQIHSRLTWIMQHSSHLPQIKSAWQEISLLPSLSSERRRIAQSMLTLAEKRQNDVHLWQQEINHLIIALKPDEHDNIIPTTVGDNDTHPWLHWLSTQFSLKHSQSQQAAALSELKSKLLNIKQNMDLEQWPRGAAWTALRAKLQLHMLKTFNTTKSTNSKIQAPTLQLPESFDAIQNDIQTLRQTAQSWLEES